MITNSIFQEILKMCFSDTKKKSFDTKNMRNLGFVFAVTFLLLFLYGLVLGTVCLRVVGLGAGNSAQLTNQYVTSDNVYWTYGAIAFAAAAVALVLLIYLAYKYSCDMKAMACGTSGPKRKGRCAY